MRYSFKAALAVLAALAANAQGDTRAVDPIATLEARLAAGSVKITAQGEHGYLQGLLDALDIPVSSQGLVFSRTSLQTDRIGPWAPRALYFNDDVYIGSVQDSPFLEVASIDPDEGTRFYTVKQDGGTRPTFVRETTTCLMCHESKSVTGGVPGIIVRSVLTDRLGYMIASWQEGSITDKTPFDQRFGGYYVTGSHGTPAHAGNTMAPMLAHEVPAREEYLKSFDKNAGGGVTDLAARFDVSRYLRPDSDVVALMVLTHQARVHNTIIQTHRAVEATEIRPGQIEGAVERLLREMLFVNEAPLSGPVRGTTDYAKTFAARGPADKQGRSLRDFDLNTRLFRYPLSFLIYSAAFDALPAPARDRFYTRLDAILTGADDSSSFSHLSRADRAAIREILEATKPEFAARRAAAGR